MAASLLAIRGLDALSSMRLLGYNRREAAGVTTIVQGSCDVSGIRDCRIHHVYDRLEMSVLRFSFSAGLPRVFVYDLQVHALCLEDLDCILTSEEGLN